MRTRILTLGTSMALAIGLLTATPAAAAYTASISFPGAASEFYSPFAGPATIQFNFDVADPSRVFRVRVRPVGGTSFVIRYFSINPATQTSPQIRQVSWDGLVTNSDKPYEVLVNPDGQSNIAVASFILRPRLVSIASATPNPFFPWINDGYKDETTIRFKLVNTAAVEAHVYRANFQGKCCGAGVETADLGTRDPGTALEAWAWDGLNASEYPFAKGDYFVKIRAEDEQNVVRWSKPFKVSIARTYRATKTTSKAAIAYHHVGPDSPLIAAGSCRVYTYAGVLRILCQTAKVTVYWRWGLADNERIEKASFVIDNPTSGCPRSIRSFGHTDHGSSMTVKDDVAGISASCRVSTAKITYSYPKSS